MTLIVFADDIGMTIVAQDIKKMEVLTNEAISEIRSWLEKAGLTLAELKTEKQTFSKFGSESFGGSYIVSKNITKYSWPPRTFRDTHTLNIVRSALQTSVDEGLEPLRQWGSHIATQKEY